MARTAPVPNIPAIPGMNPGIFVMGGGAGGAGGAGAGANGAGNKQGASGGKGGEDANGDGKGAGSCGQGTSSCPGPHGGGGAHAGDPIDVSTGRVFSVPSLDLFIPGPLKVEIERSYNSNARDRDVGLGFGWTHSFAYQLELRRRTLYLWTGAGNLLQAPLPEPGQSVPLDGGWVLVREKWGFRLIDSQGLTRLFHEQHKLQNVYRLSGVQDLNGNHLELVYDGKRWIFLVDSAGRVIRVTYTACGHIKAFEVKNSAQQGRWIRHYVYAYDDQADLVEVTDALGNCRQFSYQKHRLICEKRPSGLQIHWRYDTSGRCVETWCDYGSGTDRSLDDNVPAFLADNTTRAKGVLHCKVEYLPDAMAQVIDSVQVRSVSTNSLGQVLQGTLGSAVFSHTYDEKGNETSYCDPLGATTYFQRDELGRLTGITDPLGNQTLYEYDPKHLTRISLPSGNVFQFDYDPKGNVCGLSDAMGMLVSLTYDRRGLVEQILFANGGAAVCRYDQYGNRIEVVEPSGAKKQIEYDYLGRPKRCLDASGAPTLYQYDELGRLCGVILPTGARLIVQYDGDGHIAQITDPDGRTYGLVWAGYDVLCELQKPGGERVCYRYDREGRLTCIINEKGEQHRFERDGCGLVVQEKTFDGRTLCYQYDLAGRITAFTDGSGARTELVLDALGQVLERHYPQDCVHRLSYDAMGHVLSAETPETECRFAYNIRGKRVKESCRILNASYWVESSFDVMNQRTRRASSLGYEEKIERDVMGYPQQLLLGGSERIVSGWDGRGLEAWRQLPGGALLAQSHDANGFLIRQTLFGPRAPGAGKPPESASVLLDKVYRYTLGQELVEDWDRMRGQVRYELDGLGQLLQKIPSYAQAELFGYDPAGNPSEAGVAFRQYAPGGRCTERAGVSYYYDANGRLSEKVLSCDQGKEKVWRYDWNGRGQLRSVQRPDGSRVEFGYDAFDRRVFKRVIDSSGTLLGAETHFIWDHMKLLHEVRPGFGLKGQSVLQARTYVFSERTEEPLAHRDSSLEAKSSQHGQWVYYVNNLSQMPEYLVLSDGTLFSQLQASAWGALDDTSCTALRFAGQYADSETGLSYNVHRYYDPQLGRYISPDPIGVEGGVRLYGYAENRPHLWIDPWGLSCPSTTTITGQNNSTLATGHSQGFHTNAGTAGPNANPGLGTLPTGFPQLGGMFTGPNQCGEVEAINNMFAGLDPNDPQDLAVIRQRAQSIQNITPVRDASGQTIPPCAYCTQRLAHLSRVSGVNLFARISAPTNGRTNPFTNVGPTNQAAIGGAGLPGEFPYRVEPGNPPQIFAANSPHPLNLI